MKPGPFQLVAGWCWYRGAAFAGYQQQQGQRTVQGELLRAFCEAGLERNPVVAGRTDRGVSARMQVLSFRVRRGTAIEGLVDRLNARLPVDLQLHLAREVQHGFHAAWSATSKEYRYELGRDEVGDLELLKKAAALAVGTHDFKVFHFKSSERRPRTLHSIALAPAAGGGVTVTFVGERFARYMVRMLVGGLTAVSRGQVSLEVFERGLREQANFHCATAAPEPLTLWSVGYPPEVDPFTADERAAFVFSATKT